MKLLQTFIVNRLDQRRLTFLSQEPFWLIKNFAGKILTLIKKSGLKRSKSIKHAAGFYG